MNGFCGLARRRIDLLLFTGILSPYHIFFVSFAVNVSKPTTNKSILALRVYPLVYLISFFFDPCSYSSVSVVMKLLHIPSVID